MHDAHRDTCEFRHHLVLVNVSVEDGSSFDVQLTRVPGIGEEIIREDWSYRVIRVQHEAVDSERKTRSGWHAFVDVNREPEEPGGGGNSR
jgi:hypothetical protein